MPTRSRILVVDDDEMVVESCRRVLEPTHTLDGRGDAQAGLAALETESFDCVLLDLMLPGMSGMEALRRAKDACPDIPVVMITGYASVGTAVEAVKHGAFDYLAKPFTPEELSGAVEKAIRQRRLLQDYRRLQGSVGEQYHVSRLLGESQGMRRVFSLIEQVAATDTTVLVSGETGVGKDMVARAVHFSSPREVARFVAVDCGAVPASLIGSELFGHERGAFTGADANREGLIQAAEGGTLFLDEIGNLPMDCQATLLRALEDREVRPVGASKFEKVNVRFVAATNQDLQELVASGDFRRDLFYRLNVFPIHIPPLRERREDIPLLARHFLSLHAAKMHRDPAEFSEEALGLLAHYDWPGNVRELSNIVERLAILSSGSEISAAAMRDCLAVTASAQERGESPETPRTTEELNIARRKARDEAAAEVEKRFLLEALHTHDFNVTRASEAVAMQRTNFQALLRKHNLRIRDLEGSSVKF